MAAKFLGAAQVRERYDNLSDMSLWRWLRDDELGFPQPRYINGRRYWSESDLDRWDRRGLKVALSVPREPDGHTRRRTR
jgi:predicted DNA-binding transcriptional regulator AlpA